MHFLPVAITIVILGLYSGQMFWHVPPTSNALNALQFAAKVHGSLILASLSFIMLHHVRYRLITARRGLRLGHLMSPYQLGSPLYLLSKEFRSSITYSRTISPRDIITMLLIAYMVLLTAVADPSSAITLIPKLDEWPYTGLSELWTGSNAEYFGAPFKLLFPVHVDISFRPTADGALLMENVNPWYTLGNIISQYAEGYIGLKDGQSRNFTVGQSLLQPRNIYATIAPRDPQKGTIDGGPFIVYATTPVHKVDFTTWSLSQTLESDVLGPPMHRDQPVIPDYPIHIQAQASDSTGSYMWKQPFTMVECVDGDFNQTEFAFYNSSTLVDPDIGSDFENNNSTVLSLTPSSIPSAFYTSNTSFTFIDPDTVSMTRQVPVSAILAHGGGNHYLRTSMTVCIILAQWIDADLSTTYPTDYDSGLLPAFSFDKPSTDLGSLSNQSIITLDVAWLNSLVGDINSSSAVVFSDADSTNESCVIQDSIVSDGYTMTLNASNVDYFGSIFRLCFGVYSDCHALGLALGLTEVLSRIPHYFGIFSLDGSNSSTHGQLIDFSNTSHSGDWARLEGAKSTFTQITFNITKEVYAYGFRGITVYFAFAVLLLHVLTVIIHLLVMILGKNWSSKAWASLEQFLVLALQSSPATVLKNCVVGVETSETWRTRIMVRKTGQDQVTCKVVDENKPKWQNLDVRKRGEEYSLLLPDHYYGG